MFIVGDGAVVVEVVGDTTSKRPRCTVTILEGETKRVASDESAIKPSTYLKHLAVNVELGEHLTKYLNGNYFEKRRLRADKAHILRRTSRPVRWLQPSLSRSKRVASSRQLKAAAEQRVVRQQLRAGPDQYHQEFYVEEKVYEDLK
ncbi:hypothetical protein PR002_g19345 [Phytophthora rubi]|uniref:Uncharacterized protein n=1 Tax=Phytophthora rubi TaxID=129364 RepID=A0A6A3JR49_9STRA|nr:hypothetical protein PR002_g19345 [Phytophthora rubi]